MDFCRINNYIYLRKIIIKTFSLVTPVVFIIFNRPEKTEKVFNEIKRARPRHLFVIADGPRSNITNEKELCELTRRIIEGVDWPCQLETNFSQSNMGCKKRVSSGLDWVFEQVESAIILEDDCLPHPTFFRFCRELLDKYRLDDRVSMIGGSNFQGGKRYGDGSYYFSRYAHIWGWATWRDRWVQYRAFAGNFDRPRNIRKSVFGYWEIGFIRTKYKVVDSWAIPYARYQHYKNKITILPCQNLATNVGVDSAATHTTGYEWYLNFPILSNPCKCYQTKTEILRNIVAVDLMLESKIYRIKWWHKFIELQILGFRIHHLKGNKNSFDK